MRKDLDEAYKRQLKKHKEVKQKEETELEKKRKIIREETWELINASTGNNEMSRLSKVLSKRRRHYKA